MRPKSAHRAFPSRIGVTTSMGFAVAMAVAGAGWQEGPAGRSRVLPVSAGRGIGFTLLTPEETGVRFTNVLSDEAIARNRVLENGSGVALGDVDGDGRCDI